MLAPKNRAYLKGLANHLKPTLNLGKGDIDENRLMKSFVKDLRENKCGPITWERVHD